MKNIINMERDGHHYKVLPVENTDGEFVVIMDGARVRQVTRDELFVGDEIRDVSELF